MGWGVLIEEPLKSSDADSHQNEGDVEVQELKRISLLLLIGFMLLVKVMSNNIFDLLPSCQDAAGKQHMER